MVIDYPSYKRLSGLGLLLCLAACNVNNDNAHTTATSYVSPPPHQVLTVVSGPSTEGRPLPSQQSIESEANLREPLLTFNLKNGTTFRVGQPIPIDFTIRNAKLKNEGGNFRVRYIVDDGEMQWLDESRTIWLAGWLAGEHTIRLELIGPDGWPYRNGNANIVTRKIFVTN